MNMLTSHPKLLATLIAAAFSLPAQAIDMFPEKLSSTDLGTLKSNNSEWSKVTALSSNGNIAAGWASSDNAGYQHAAVWSGRDYATKTDLGIIYNTNEGWSHINALNSEGNIAAGWAYNDRGFQRATTWAGAGYADITDLGTLKSDNSGWSNIIALSSNGRIAAGWASNDHSAQSHAAIWSGAGYTVKTDLGTLKSDNSGQSIASALSSDGTIAAGLSEEDSGNTRATVWSGADYATKTDLGTLKSDNSGKSIASALSSDGRIIAGTATNNKGEWHATVWSGTGYATKTDLGTLKSDNSGQSQASALISGGGIAAGWAQSDRELQRATVWSGNSYAIKTDLGTLKSDNSGSSDITALSGDGFVAAGWAETDSLSTHAAVWRLHYLMIDMPPTPVTPTPPSTPVQTSIPLEILSKTDLGTLKSDNSSWSNINALSSNGNIAAGWASSDNADYQHAAVWSGSNYATKTDLGIIKSDNSGWSQIYALNGDGNIAAGWANDNGNQRATVWSGTSYTAKADLGTLKSDNSGWSTVAALSKSGQIAAGWAYNDSDQSHATIWSGTAYTAKTDLGTLNADNSGNSAVYALSSNDGSVAAGWAHNSSFTQHATVWSGTDYATKTDLGTLKSDNSGQSMANALSSDGSYAAGWAHNDNANVRATIWSGTGYATKTDLGTLKNDNSGQSQASALTSNGGIAAGWAQSDSEHQRATVWSGNNYAIKTDLGTLKSNNSGSSDINALSGDGLVAAGWAETDSKRTHAAVWRLHYLATIPVTPTPVTPTPVTPTPPPIVSKPVDVDNTLASMAALGRDNFAALTQASDRLQHIQHGCLPDTAGRWCVSAQTGNHREDDAHYGDTSFSAAYAFNPHIAAGMALGTSFASKLPESSYANGVGALGLYGRWQGADSGNRWYVRPAVSWLNGDAELHRPKLSGTETASSKQNVSGYAAELATGYILQTGKGVQWDIQAGLRHHHVKRAAYTETDVDFPVNYNAMTFHDTSLFAGVSAEVPLTPALTWQTDAEVAQSVKQNDAQYRASAPFIGNYATDSNYARTRALLRTGVTYHPNQSVSLGLYPYIGHGLSGKTTSGADLRLMGRF